MKVWHDDIRRPPDDSWVWARTNAEAIGLLEQNDVIEISLDHDLGLEEVDPEIPSAFLLKGSSPKGTGVVLVEWMCDTGRVPPTITIHSWNPDGARRMAWLLDDRGYGCTIAPYRVWKEDERDGLQPVG